MSAYEDDLAEMISEGGWRPADQSHRSAAAAIIAAIRNEYADELITLVGEHFVPHPPGQTADYVRGLDDGMDTAADLIRETKTEGD